MLTIIRLWCTTVASIGHLQMNIWSYLELTYKWEDHNFCVKLQEWLAVFNYTSDFRELAVYLVTNCYKRHRISINMAIHETLCMKIYLIKLLYLPTKVRLYSLRLLLWYFVIKIWKQTEFHTRDGGSPTKDGDRWRRTTTHMIKTKKSVINCAFLLELTQNYCNFWLFTLMTDIIFDTDLIDSIQISTLKYQFSMWISTRPK